LPFFGRLAGPALFNSVTGPTGAPGPTGALGATGAPDPLTPQLNQGNVLGDLADWVSWKFLHIGGAGAGNLLDPASVSGSGQTLVVQAGGSYKENFSLASDKLDLTQVLSGAPLAHDLTNISQFVKIVSHGPSDPGFAGGGKTTLEITPPGGGSALVTLEGSGNLTLKQLLNHDSLLLPPH